MASQQELACIYAALALQDDDVNITAEKIQKMLEAANVEVETFWPGVYAKALQGVDVKSLISNIGSGVGQAPAAGAAPAASAPAAGGGGGAPPKEEKKKEQPKEESEEEDMGFGLFD